MAIIWNLRRWLATEHEIYRPTELRAILAERAGYHLTLQAVSTLMKRQPSELRLQTIEALCRSLQCHLSDFCEVGPDTEAAVSEDAGDDAPRRQRKRISDRRREIISLPGPARPVERRS